MDPQTPPPPPPPSVPQSTPTEWTPGAPPPAVPWTTPPPTVTTRRRRNFVPLIVLVVVVGVIAGGYFLFRDRIGGDVFDLRVGDCIDLPSDTGEVSDVQHQPCTSSHDAEVFANITDPAAGNAPFPGSDHFRTLVEQQCVPAATAYIGTDFNASNDLGLGWFRPTSDTWGSKNDRVVTCYLYRIDGTKLNTSLKGAGG